MVFSKKILPAIAAVEFYIVFHHNRKLRPNTMKMLRYYKKFLELIHLTAYNYLVVF